MLRLYQRSMNGPRGPVPGRRVEMTLRDAVVLVPLVAVMGLIALWPQSLVGATTASVERALAPAQVVLERPQDQIRSAVVPNPPDYAQPLPGDPAPAEPSTQSGQETP
jgi:hypothetical protein